MLHYLFAFMMIVHGLIHLAGYSRSFHYSELKNITVLASKPTGVLWITTCLLFIIAAVFFLLKKDYWWIIAIVSMILSQLVIILNWKAAKFGTIVNILILLIIILES